MMKVSKELLKKYSEFIVEEILFNRVNLLSKIVIKNECIFPIKNNKE